MMIFNVYCLMYPFIVKVEQAENMNNEQVSLHKILCERFRHGIN